MSKRQTKAETRQNRIEAINAAAIAFSGGAYERIEELWSLTVFFERYLERGARGTLKQFGPAEPGKAPVLKMVPRK
jgi:hypothetical protein